MGKTLIVGSPGTIANGNETNAFGGVSNATETTMQVPAPEELTLSNFGNRIVSGGSGTNTATVRNDGANGNQSTSYAGTGTGEDVTNTDTILEDDVFNVAMSDTGSDPSYRWIKFNLELATGHGCIHTSLSGGQVCDNAGTRIIAISGPITQDGESVATEPRMQMEIREYDEVEAFFVRVSSNARVNDTTFRLRQNGTAVGDAIVYTAAESGLKIVKAQGLSLSAGDLLAASIGLGAGVEDIVVCQVGVLLKSSSGGSQNCALSVTGATRSASGTATYYVPGGVPISGDTTESNQRVRVGFAAIARGLLINISANTYSTDATLSLYVDGVAQIDLTIPAGTTGWVRNLSDVYEVDDTEGVCFGIVGGTTGSITFHALQIGWGATSAEQSGAGAAAGAGDAAGVGASIFAAAGSAAGSGDATASSDSGSAIGAAAGSGAAAAVGESTRAAVGSAAGTGAATASGSNAGDPIAPPTISSTSCEAWNKDTGRIYYQKAPGPEGEVIGASTAKMMTLYTLLKYHPDKADLQARTTTITTDDLTAGGSGANLNAGDILSLHSLMANAMLPSSNNSCMAIAAYVGREILANPGATHAAAVAAFVAEMNATAALLEMNDTLYLDPHGNSLQETTAHDTSQIFAQVCENPIMIEIWRFQSHLLPLNRSGSDTTIRIDQTNLRHASPGVISGKTGSQPSENVYNIEVAVEAPNGQIVIIAMLGAPNAASRFTDLDAILDQIYVDFPELSVAPDPWDVAYLFDTLGCGGGYWDASTLASLFQTTDESTPVTTPGDTVGRMNSLDGTGGTPFTQTTAGARPTYSESTSEEYLNFATDNFLDLGVGEIGATGLFATTGEQFMVAMKARTADTLGTLLARAGSTASARTFQLFVDSGNNDNPGCYMRGVNYSPDDGVNDNEIRCFGAWWDGTSGAMERTPLGSGQIAVGTAAEETTQRIIIGARTNGTTSFLEGDMFSLVITDEYDAEQFRRLRDWSQGAVVNKTRVKTLEDGDALASGSGAAAGVGASIAAAVGSASGSGDATGSAAGTVSAVGAAAGTGAATSVGAPIVAAVAQAAGAGTATGSTSDGIGVGAASGSGDATAIGASIAAAVGSAAGTGAASGATSSDGSGIGAASGVGDAVGVAASIAAAVGAAAGTGDAAGSSTGFSSAVGSAAGTGAADASSIGVAAGVGSAAGVGDVIAWGSSTFSAVGLAAGSGDASTSPEAVTSGVGAAQGVGAADAVGREAVLPPPTDFPSRPTVPPAFGHSIRDPMRGRYPAQNRNPRPAAKPRR